MPRCLGASGSVRTSSSHQSATCASVVQIFWPVMTQSSPSRTAVVRSDARSEPASGSEKPWHQMSSPRRIRGSSAVFWSSVPCAMSGGATFGIPITLIGPGAPERCSSSFQTSWSSTPAPRPPYSTGHAMAA